MSLAEVLSEAEVSALLDDTGAASAQILDEVHGLCTTVNFRDTLRDLPRRPRFDAALKEVQASGSIALSNLVGAEVHLAAPELSYVSRGAWTSSRQANSTQANSTQANSTRANSTRANSTRANSTRANNANVKGDIGCSALLRDNSPMCALWSANASLACQLADVALGGTGDNTTTAIGTTESEPTAADLRLLRVALQRCHEVLASACASVVEVDVQSLSEPRPLHGQEFAPSVDVLLVACWQVEIAGSRGQLQFVVPEAHLDTIAFGFRRDCTEALATTRQAMVNLAKLGRVRVPLQATLAIDDISVAGVHNWRVGQLLETGVVHVSAPGVPAIAAGKLAKPDVDTFGEANSAGLAVQVHSARELRA